MDGEAMFVDAGALLEEVEREPTEPEWLKLFEYDRYDWSDPEWLQKNKGRYAWLPIILSQTGRKSPGKYFMMVWVGAYARMTTYKNGKPRYWTVHIQRHPETGDIVAVYAVRRGRPYEGEPSIVGAHVELAGALGTNAVVDHKNGMGLDNRHAGKNYPVNLSRTSIGINRHNCVVVRTKNFDLPTGVERRAKDQQGRPRYCGVYWKRTGKKRRAIRSKRTWLTPEPAARWYRSQLRRLHRRGEWAHNPESVNWPAFPPLLDSQISEKSQWLRDRASAPIERELELAIPF